MTFTLKPIDIPDDFTFTGNMLHLTYKGHVAPEVLLATVRRATSVPILGYSVAHEDTSEYNDEGYQMTEGYKHTHLAIIFKSKIKKSGSRSFDAFVSDEEAFGNIQQIHPHFQPRLTMVQMELLFTQYHAGRKFDIATGKTVFKPPVLHVYQLPPMFDFHRAIMEEVVSAPNLFEACIAGQVRPRNVADIKALRAEAPAVKKFQHKFVASSFAMQAPASWQVLHIYGGSGLGKTKWACAQFDNPCVVKPFDSIGCLESLDKLYDPNFHDGIVLDEVDLRFMTRQQVIALFDPDEDCTIDVRFKSFVLPSKVKKILCSNPSPSELYPDDKYGAIARRSMSIHVTHPLWLSLPARPALSPSPTLATPINMTPHTQTPP